MNILIVDDEEFALTRLERILKSNENVTSVTSFSTTNHIMDYLEEASIHVLFVDYEMPGKSGLELAKEVKRYCPEILIVFVTAYDDYSLEAFDIHASDYILKPYNETRIHQSIDRLALRLSEFHKEKSQQESEIVPIHVASEIRFYEKNEILFFKSNSKNTIVMTVNGPIDSIKSLKFYEQRLLQPPFLKVHRSYMVNLEQISKLIPDIKSVYMICFKNSKEKIPLSRSRVKLLKKIFDMK